MSDNALTSQRTAVYSIIRLSQTAWAVQTGSRSCVNPENKTGGDLSITAPDAAGLRYTVN